MRKVFLFLFFSTFLFCFDESSTHFIEALPKQNLGKKLYLQHCASCHHKDRIGLEGPPLYKKVLKKFKTISNLAQKIKDGFPQTLMPKFENLSESDRIAIAKYIFAPLDKNITWGKNEISASLKRYKNPKKNLHITNIANVMPVVERDGGKVWIMQDEKILDKFRLKNVHGGIKYRFPSLDSIFVPTRDGYVVKYSLKNGRVEDKIRACINLRNIALSRDGKYLFVSCLLPEQIVIFNPDNFTIEKIEKIDGKISAIYDLYTQDKMIFTLRNHPKVGFIDTKNLKITYKKIDEPIEDFFIDPFDKFIIATQRRGRWLRVYTLDSLQKVYEHTIAGMPHLFSATTFYKDGNFYFATPHLRSKFITIWKMYDWDFVKKIEIGGDGFFAKTHPATPYLWVDNGSDEVVLIKKKDYSIKKLVPAKGKRYIHAEFSGDGKYTYLSIYEKDGALQVWDTKKLKLIKSYKANKPVGKYNFICKNRRYYLALFGLDIYYQKCKNKSLQCLKELKNLNYLEQKSIHDLLQYRKFFDINQR